jgi:hypothetical protein
MGIGSSLFLIAAGAILKFAVEVHSKTVDLDALGWILMIVGAVGVILSIFFWQTWGGFPTSGDAYSSRRPAP